MDIKSCHGLYGTTWHIKFLSFFFPVFRGVCPSSCYSTSLWCLLAFHLAVYLDLCGKLDNEVLGLWGVLCQRSAAEAGALESELGPDASLLMSCYKLGQVPWLSLCLIFTSIKSGKNTALVGMKWHRKCCPSQWTHCSPSTSAVSRPCKVVLSLIYSAKGFHVLYCSGFL